jgi:hypothetical protein
VNDVRFVHDLLELLMLKAFGAVSIEYVRQAKRPLDAIEAKVVIARSDILKVKMRNRRIRE